VTRVFQSRCTQSWSGAVAILISLLLAPAAAAQQSDFSLQFASTTPGAATAMHLYIVYRTPADPNGKPSPIRHLVISAPQGTRIDLAMARCTATDDEIMAAGPSACPAASQVGQGTLTAITGFGAPTDPYLTDVTIFNTGQGVVEIARDHRTGATITDDRIQIQGNVLTGNPPAFPGGPPDGQTAVRTIDFTFPASSHYITSPPSCPTGQWTSQASFSFADGSTQHVSSTTPCSATPPDATPPAVGRFAISPRRFAVARASTPVSARTGRGAKFRYTLSEPATAKITISRAAPGRRSERTCKRPTHDLRRAKRCTRFVEVGTLTRKAQPAGKNTVKFSGRIGGRALKPARYHATITATDPAGNHSKPSTTAFKIVRD
jgi:hypothetical protein